MAAALADVLDELKELRREFRALRVDVRAQGINLALLVEAVRGQGIRVSSLERRSLTPAPEAPEAPEGE